MRASVGVWWAKRAACSDEGLELLRRALETGDYYKWNKILG